MERRAFIKAMASLPTAISLGGGFKELDAWKTRVFAPGVPITQLNVAFHGLFLIHFDQGNSRIAVSTPSVMRKTHKHVYRAGAWTVPDCAPDPPHERDLTESEYTLSINTSVAPAFPTKANYANTDAVVSTPLQINDDLRFRTIYLPPTAALASLNCVSRPDGAFFSGHVADINSINPGVLARTHVFTYTIASGVPKLLRTDQSTFWAPADSASGVVNLHVFAEPEHFLSRVSMGSDVFNTEFRAMLGNPDLSFIPFSATPPFRPASCNFMDPRGFSQDEEKSLGERLCSVCSSDPTCPRAGEVANCTGIIYAP
jgi:hypothetical protein